MAEEKEASEKVLCAFPDASFLSFDTTKLSLYLIWFRNHKTEYMLCTVKPRIVIKLLK